MDQRVERVEAEDEAQRIADRVREAMFANDRASRALGMRITHIAPGKATMTMTVRADMLNGFGTCHGGLIATLADSAFAFACNSSNRMAVAAGLSIDFVAPAQEGDLLTAEAVEVSQAGRSGVYDVTVSNQRGERVALFRGRSHRVNGRSAVAEIG
ncbi:MAG TPA: hydroxyphenylacetyl-CoA thioesterase PaaI [Burkholderiaceae bacterium]|nr:hydroxyphenylacetyl-CoA thioesterase PaaI [Burkholderiaceae bacterium]